VFESKPDERETIQPEPAQQGFGESGSQAAEPEAPGLVRQAVRIAELRLLFDFASTSQLSELVPITPLPATPHWMRGLASLHGMVLPVFDLAALIGVERAPSQKRLLLVVGHGDSAAAILIDGLPDRFRFAESERTADRDAHPWLSDCAAAAYSRDNQTWLDIDHTRLLDKIEQSLRTPG
jgi:purine-binding chemotaxis protein CheW